MKKTNFNGGVFMNKKCLVITFPVLVLAVLLFGRISVAAGYPERPIEIFIPYAAGSSMDIMARLIAEIAPTYMNQPLVIVAKPGASGALAAAEVVSSKPDGYKLVVEGQMFFSSTTKTQNIPFDPADLVPLANFMAFRLAMMVRSDSSWKTLNDLVEYARKNPGQLKWAHSGRGGPPHMIGQSIFKKAGAKTVDVPYKGGNETLAALLGGHVDAISNPYGIAQDQVRAGKVRTLAFYSDQRYADQPNIPSIAELGYTDAAKLMTFVGIYCHKNTPEPVKQYLMTMFKKIYDDPRFRKLPDIGGEDPRWGGPDFIMQKMKDSEEIAVPMLKELGFYKGK